MEATDSAVTVSDSAPTRSLSTPMQIISTLSSVNETEAAASTACTNSGTPVRSYSAVLACGGSGRAASVVPFSSVSSADEKVSTSDNCAQLTPLSEDSISQLLSQHSNQLQLFLTAQDSTHGRCASYAVALKEMQRGRKTSHWIWYIFPSFLCTRRTNQPELQFENWDAAEAFILHPILQKRAVQITAAAAQHIKNGVTADELMGKQAKYDTPKLHEFLSVAALIAQKYECVPAHKIQLNELIDVCLTALKGMKVNVYEQIVNLVNARTQDLHLLAAVNKLQKRGLQFHGSAAHSISLSAMGSNDSKRSTTSSLDITTAVARVPSAAPVTRQPVHRISFGVAADTEMAQTKGNPLLE